jgi:hypothetical protein
VSAPGARLGVCRDARGANPPPSPRTLAEGQLEALLRATGIPRSGVYRPGEVCRLLRISRSTLLGKCGWGPVHHPHIAIENAGPGHGLAGDAHLEGRHRHERWTRLPRMCDLGADSGGASASRAAAAAPGGYFRAASTRPLIGASDAVAVASSPCRWIR